MSNAPIIRNPTDVSPALAAKLQDPDHTLVLIPDNYTTKTEHLNHDGMADITHGDMITSILAGDPRLASEFAQGNVTIATINPEEVSDVALLNALPQDHAAQVMLNFSIGTPGADQPEEVQAMFGGMIDAIKARADNPNFTAFVANGNDSRFGDYNYILHELEGQANVVPVAAGSGLIGREETGRLDVRSSVYAPDGMSANEAIATQNVFNSAMVIDQVRGGYDINRDGIADIGSANTASLPESELTMAGRNDNFATLQDISQITHIDAFQPDMLYPMSMLTSDAARNVTDHLPNLPANIDEIYVSGATMQTINMTGGILSEGAFFVKNEQGQAELLDVPNDLNYALKGSSTSFAVPNAIAGAIAGDVGDMGLALQSSGVTTPVDEVITEPSAPTGPTLDSLLQTMEQSADRNGSISR